MDIGKIVKFFIRRNEFWEDGELVEKALVENNIRHLQTILGEEVDSVHIFGSVARIKDRKYIHIPPNDIDLYLTTPRLITDVKLIEKVREESKNLVWPGNLPPHVQICHIPPFENYQLDVTHAYQI